MFLMKIITKKLANGLDVIFIKTHTFPTVTTLMLVGAGSRYENKENNGIAHFFEHMAFKGSKKYPTSFDISNKIEGLGGVFNAFTSKDHTGYYVKSPISHFSEVVDVLSDMLLHSKLDKEEIEREKGVIVEEINMYEDMPARKVSDVFDEAVFEGNPLAFDIAGSAKTVRSFTQKTFKDYIGKLYHPNNATLVIAGGISTDENNISKYLETIEMGFGSWQGSSNHNFEKYSPSQTNPILNVRHKKTEQAHFSLGFRAFSFSDKRRYALTLLSSILGGGMSSRLFIELRERRGLCYYVSTGRELYQDTGYLVTQAGVTNNISQLNEAINIVREEHQNIVKNGVTEDELKRSKEHLKGGLLLSLEDSYRAASTVGTKYLFTKEVVAPEEIIKRIDDVKTSDVQSLAQEILLEDQMTVALIGPYKKEEISL